MNLKVGDKVVVITGSNKGKEGTIKKVLKADNKVIIDKRRYYCYYWDDGFDVIDESLDYDDNGSYDEYTWEDSLYDALDGHMDAIWNID